MPKWNQLWKIALRQCSEAGVWSVISRWCFVEVMKLGLVHILNLKFSRDADVWSRFWGWCLVGRSEDEIWSRLVLELVIRPKEVTLVSRTQPSGPLCLWQCLLFYLYLSFECPWFLVVFAPCLPQSITQFTRKWIDCHDCPASTDVCVIAHFTDFLA